MANVECRDIFNAVYTYVRGSYISNLYSSKVKTTIENAQDVEDGSDETTTHGENNTKSNRYQKENYKDINLSVKEKTERDDESKVADKIRMDIDEKFPFALASVCSNLAVIDKEYRKIKEMDEQPDFSEYILEVDDEFPLADRFVFPAIMYVTSMVLIDVDEKKSDDYYEKYASSVSKIISELHFDMGTTVEKYPY